MVSLKKMRVFYDQILTIPCGGRCCPDLGYVFHVYKWSP